MQESGAKPKRSWVMGLASVLIGVSVALIGAEVLVRIFFEEPIQPRFVYDGGYGVRANQPNVDTRHYMPGDYDVRITTNSAGMRGQREYAIEKPAGVRRVLVLGDSFPYGYGVEDDQVVSAVLEDDLNGGRKPGGPRYEVINLSVSGFGQAEELVTYQARGRAYGPDVVLLFFFENDIGNNAVSRLFTVNADGSVTRAGREFLPGVRIQAALYLLPPVRLLFEHSQAWNLVRNRLSALVQKSLLRGQGLEKFNDTSPRGMTLTDGLLRELVREVRADGAVPLIVVIPDRRRMDSVFPYSAQDVSAMGALLIDGREYLSPDDYYVRDSHWRPSGHRKTAARLAEMIGGLP